MTLINIQNSIRSILWVANLLHTMCQLINIGFKMHCKCKKTNFLHFYKLKTFFLACTLFFLLYLYFYDYNVKFHIFSLIKPIFNQNSIKRRCAKYEKIMNIEGLIYFHHEDAM